MGARALEILLVLVERPGELVTRAELMDAVWPDTTVDENALRVHLSQLRKALGDGQASDSIILNEPGRGYRFIADVQRHDHPDNDPPPIYAEDAGGSLPKNLTRLIGRETVIEGVVELLEERHFLTIAGPGGIGKTTVAIAAARQFASKQRIIAHFVDLAPLSDPHLVSSALATQLGLAASSAVERSVVDALSERHYLLVFDNCEHLADAVANLIEAILQTVPKITLLVTSREPLRAEAEWVYRLPSLESPPAGSLLSVASALAYASVRLFCERARASYHEFELTDDDVAPVIKICNQLDGIPLAIEMAAARLDTLDVHAVASKLDDRFTLLNRGRRTALPRQQTLRATLDWSHDFLSSAERRVFRRLSVFRSSFRPEGVQAVCELEESAALDTLTALVTKSLVAFDRREKSSLYRLLDTTRFYAGDMLLDANELPPVSRLHAAYCLALFEKDQIAWDGNDPGRMAIAHRWRIDDIRAAIDWALTETGEAEIAVRLAIASGPLWFHLSLPGEYLSVLERAKRLVEGKSVVRPGDEAELLMAYGHALWHTEGPNNSMESAFSRALEIAHAEIDDDRCSRALWGIWAQSILAGNYRLSLSHADRFRKHSDRFDDLAHRVTADHMASLSHHFLGNQKMAQELLNAVSSADETPERAHHTNHAQVDGRIAGMALSMRLLWLNGQHSRSIQLAQDCAREIAALGHDLSTCYGLAIGCIQIALWAGRRDLATEWNSVLASSSEARGIRHWQIWSDGFSCIMSGEGELPSDASQMQIEAFARCGASVHGVWISDRLDEQPELWCREDLLRILAEQPEGAG